MRVLNLKFSVLWLFFASWAYSIFLLKGRGEVVHLFSNNFYMATSDHLETFQEQGIVFSKLDAVINWVRANSIWPQPMGLACCAIELMGVGGSRFDIGRFGAEVMRFSPRQSDCMIVAGTVTYKQAGAVKRIYDQMANPKWVIAMGACACSGGMFRTYSTLQGLDKIIPVDVYLAGCPPRPEALLDALIKLQEKIKTEHSAKNLFKAVQ